MQQKKALFSQQDARPLVTPELTFPWQVARRWSRGSGMRSTKAVRIASGVVLSAVYVWAQVITTVAGTDWVFPVSSLPAVNAPLGNVQGIAVDAKGNTYVADNGNNMIMRISRDGTLTVVAGNGILGCSGDGGPATRAAIAHPVGLALDVSGNLFITDGCNLVRKVTPDGTITTVAGNGVAGFSGDGGPATSTALWFPWGVAVDAGGNLYIADSLNNRVRRVTPSGTIATVAGSGYDFFGGFGGDGAPLPARGLTTQSMWPWTPMVISTLQTVETTAFAKWRPTVRSLRQSGVDHKAFPAMGGQRRGRRLTALPA